MGLILFGDARTASGTFQDGDIKLNKEGIRVVSQTQTATVSTSCITPFPVVAPLGFFGNGVR